MKDMRFSDIDDKLFVIREDLEKLGVGLNSYNRELVDAFDDHIALKLARPHYEIALDYTDKVRRAINELMQHVQELHDQTNEVHYKLEK